MRYIDYNPVRDVEKPKGKSTYTDNTDINVLEPYQISDLLNSTPELKYKTLFMVAVTTGLRQGELLGLKWTDIDWINKQINVCRTYNHFRFYEPKTKSSKRKVDVPAETIQQLRKWKIACLANDFNLVFPNDTGGPMSSINMYNRKFLTAIKKAGLSIRFHDLRHTYASIQIDLGTNIKYIQSQMAIHQLS